ncbi:hypothetical protein Kpho01_61620 [Kitasatospora phosalacinea]|uniref:Uncharacterized protein n=1 Tax=Kitasatospora phosalacinea TaxID=2065 RepID=A0A9W6UQ44_9ACTN|nr:hypothetical protein Kpho01_61620 [Kitasatospora phosalacinea]
MVPRGWSGGRFGEDRQVAGDGLAQGAGGELLLLAHPVEVAEDLDVVAAGDGAVFVEAEQVAGQFGPVLSMTALTRIPLYVSLRMPAWASSTVTRTPPRRAMCCWPTVVPSGSGARQARTEAWVGAGFSVSSGSGSGRGGEAGSAAAGWCRRSAALVGAVA